MKTLVFFAFVFLTFAAMMVSYAFIKYWLLPFFRLLKNYDKAIKLVVELNKYPVLGKIKDIKKNFEERSKLLVESGISKEELDLLTKKSFLLAKNITEVLSNGKECTKIFKKQSAKARTGTGTGTTGRARRFPRRETSGRTFGRT